MASKNITLSVDEKVYEKYREFCKKKGLMMSRQFEILMEDQLKKEGTK
jgi:antitoxin component of RelBE/YafQ-DinJ toxin-antitoxin module